MSIPLAVRTTSLLGAGRSVATGGGVAMLIDDACGHATGYVCAPVSGPAIAGAAVLDTAHPCGAPTPSVPITATTDGPRWRILDHIPTWAHWSVRHPPGL